MELLIDVFVELLLDVFVELLIEVFVELLLDAGGRMRTMRSSGERINIGLDLQACYNINTISAKCTRLYVQA